MILDQLNDTPKCSSAAAVSFAVKNLSHTHSEKNNEFFFAVSTMYDKNTPDSLLTNLGIQMYVICIQATGRRSLPSCI